MVNVVRCVSDDDDGDGGDGERVMNLLLRAIHESLETRELGTKGEGCKGGLDGRERE